MLPCTNDWHHKAKFDRTKACPSCGERLDGKRTLGNLLLEIGLFSVLQLYNEETDERYEGSMKVVDSQGFHLTGGKIVPIEEASDWLVVGTRLREESENDAPVDDMPSV